jgi:hypothetical protein
MGSPEGGVVLLLRRGPQRSTDLKRHQLGGRRPVTAATYLSGWSQSRTLRAVILAS